MLPFNSLPHGYWHGVKLSTCVESSLNVTVLSCHQVSVTSDKLLAKNKG